MPSPANLHSEDRITAAINLLTALSAAPGLVLPREQAAQVAGVSEDQMPQIIDLIATLADHRTGARAVVYLEGPHVVLQGDAATLRPIRLTEEEGAVLGHVLNALNIDEDARARLAAAVLPLGVAEAGRDLIAEPERYGDFFPQLREAIQDGVRCVLTYRSLNDDAPTQRLIDPYVLINGGARTYLRAWDVEQDDQRLYRLDRIAHVAFTEDSVERHPYRNESITESLRDGGALVTVLIASEARARELNWDGMQLVHTLEDGRVQAEVVCASERWLYSQVLAAGGAIEIVAPASLRRGLAAYAAELLSC